MKEEEDQNQSLFRLTLKKSSIYTIKIYADEDDLVIDLTSINAISTLSSLPHYNYFTIFFNGYSYKVESYTKNLSEVRNKLIAAWKEILGNEQETENEYLESNIFQALEKLSKRYNKIIQKLRFTMPLWDKNKISKYSSLIKTYQHFRKDIEDVLWKYGRK